MAGKRKLNARQLRFLFARGVLRGKGSGKDRKVTYNKNAGKSRSERIAAGRKKAAEFLANGKGLALVKAVKLQEAGRVKQADTAASAAGLSVRAVRGIGSRGKTTGRNGNLRRAAFGEYGKSAPSLERGAGRSITRDSIRRTQEHWQAELNRRAHVKALTKALKPFSR